MTCREFADLIIGHVSGELSPESHAAFEQHLSLCSNCRQYLVGYQEAVRLGKLAFEDDDAHVPSPVPEEFVKLILAGRPRH